MQSGWYDKPLTRQDEAEIARTPQSFSAVDKLNDVNAAAAAVVAFMQPLIERKLTEILSSPDTDRASQQALTFINTLLQSLDSDARLSEPLRQLRYYFAPQDTLLNAAQLKAITPLTPLSLPALFTGDSEEATLAAALKNELQTADEVWLVVSFIRYSALQLLYDALHDFCAHPGHRLHVFTTTYTGATQASAVATIAKLPQCAVYVNYSSLQTRMHAKGYIFVRRTGFSTAYIGSSNLSTAALTRGLEWNLKLSEYHTPALFAKLRRACERYRADTCFERFKAATPQELQQSLTKLQTALQAENQRFGRDGSSFALPAAPPALQLMEHQLQMLTHLQAQRQAGNWRNLVVAATGTGKTMLAAFDFANFVKGHPRARLLFVAHRKEILQQARATFARVLNAPNFGEMLSGGEKPQRWEHVFATIETLCRLDLAGHAVLSNPTHFDVLMVDEVHHGSAASYQRLFDAHYFAPKLLLGLTATPERMDGQSILPYFNDVISTELRLPEAVNRGLLVPFIYFGISDNIDLTEVSCKRGMYDEAVLEALYTAGTPARQRADLILTKVQEITDGMAAEVRGLGFCVSIGHARFMAACFNQAGIPSAAVHARIDAAERAEAQHKLRSGKLKFLFTVDLFNEGIDIPCLNLLLFLRPTQSLTVFVQQLGRGLRRDDARHKTELTVLDFVGQANRNYDFEEKFSALFTKSVSLKQEIAQGFPDLPQGCALTLERKAQAAILENIAKSYATPDYLFAKFARMQDMLGRTPHYGEFLDYYGFTPGMLYGKPKRESPRSFYRLLVRAQQRPQLSSSLLEHQVNQACMRLRNLNALPFILALRRYLSWQAVDAAMLPYLRMFYVTLCDREAPRDNARLLQFLDDVRKAQVLREELYALLDYRLSHGELADKPVLEQLPLALYGQYTTVQALCAGDIALSQRQNGVSLSKRFKADFIFVTLHKAQQLYSERTRYADCIVDKKHVIWQTPHATTPESPAGQRYIDEQASKIVFVRSEKQDAGKLAVPYTCLGLARSTKRYHGSKPISLELVCDHPIPDHFLGLGTPPAR